MRTNLKNITNSRRGSCLEGSIWCVVTRLALALALGTFAEGYGRSTFVFGRVSSLLERVTKRRASGSRGTATGPGEVGEGTGTRGSRLDHEDVEMAEADRERSRKIVVRRRVTVSTSSSGTKIISDTSGFSVSANVHGGSGSGRGTSGTSFLRSGVAAPALPDMTEKCGPWGPFGTNLGSWFDIEGWMFDGDAYFNTGGGKGSNPAEWQVLNKHIRAKMKKDGKDDNAHSLLLMHSHWANFVSEALLDDFHSAGVNLIRIPIGHWLFNEWNEKEAHPTRNGKADVKDPKAEPPLWFSVENYAVGGLRVLEDALPHFYKRCIRVMLDVHAVPGVGAPDQGFAGYKAGTACFHTGCNPMKDEPGDLKLAEKPYGDYLAYMKIITKRAFEWINNVNKHFPGLVVSYQALNEPKNSHYVAPDPDMDNFLTGKYFPMLRDVAAEVKLDPVVELCFFIMADGNKRGQELAYLNEDKWKKGFPTTKYAGYPKAEWGGQEAIWDFHPYVEYDPKLNGDAHKTVTQSHAAVYKKGNSVLGEWSVSSNFNCGQVGDAKRVWGTYMDVVKKNNVRAHIYWNGRMGQDGTQKFAPCKNAAGKERYCLASDDYHAPVSNRQWCWSLASMIKHGVTTGAAEKGKSIAPPDGVIDFANAVIVKPKAALDAQLPRRAKGTWFKGGAGAGGGAAAAEGAAAGGAGEEGAQGGGAGAGGGGAAEAAGGQTPSDPASPPGCYGEQAATATEVAVPVVPAATPPAAPAATPPAAPVPAAPASAAR